MYLIEKFKEEKLSEAQERENKANEWRNAFIAEYPRDAIISMQMNSYLTSRSRYGNTDSFCRRICSKLEAVFHIQTKRMLPVIFGISLSKDTQLTLSKTLTAKFDSDYDKAFIYIKNEIYNLLDAADKNNYADIECCELHSSFKSMLLIIYFSEKFVPVCEKSLLIRHCERVGITFNPYGDMIYSNNALIEWKNAVPEIADWSNSILTSFCDWLYRKDMTINGNSLRRDADTSIAKITQEIEELNLQGKSKEAFIKVRINQGIFRDRLFQRYNKCCLCNVSNRNLLVASHIKPWSESEPDEKVDSDNGFLMCPNHDRLFDQGWISFDDNGNIIIANRLSLESRMPLNIRDNMKVSLTEKNKKYLQFHRKSVFQNI